MDKYTKVKVLGKGSFGSATLIKRKTDSQLFVVKEVNLARMGAKEREEARNEVKILSKLAHPNIVRFVEHVERKGMLYIIMEYADGGDLHQKIKAQKNTRMKESTIMHYFVQIALALDYLHGRHILHRDIKSMNVFLTSKGTVKLGDFGISTVLRNTMGLANTVCGTPYYFCPELCRNQPYNNKSDVWALGVLLYEMCALRHPFDGNSMNELMQRIVRSPYPPLPLSFSASLRSVVASCLEKDHTRRPTVRTLLNVDIVQAAMLQLGEDLAAATEQKTRLQNIVAHREEPSSSEPPSKQSSPVDAAPAKVLAAKPVAEQQPVKAPHPVTPPPRQPNDRPAVLAPQMGAVGVDPRRPQAVPPPVVAQHAAGAHAGAPIPRPPVAAVPTGYVEQMRNVADFISDLKRPMHVLLQEKERDAAQRRAAEDLARREAERKLREREQQIERDRRTRAAAAAAKERQEQQKRDVQQKERERHLAELRRVMEEHDKKTKQHQQLQQQQKVQAAKESPRIAPPPAAAAVVVAEAPRQGRAQQQPDYIAARNVDRTPSPQVVRIGQQQAGEKNQMPEKAPMPYTPPAQLAAAPRPMPHEERPAVSSLEAQRLQQQQQQQQQGPSAHGRQMAIAQKAHNWVEREADRKRLQADVRRAEEQQAVREMDRHHGALPPVGGGGAAAPAKAAAGSGGAAVAVHHGRRRSQEHFTLEQAIMAPAPEQRPVASELKHGVVDPELDEWVRRDAAKHKKDALASPQFQRGGAAAVGNRANALRKSVDEADRVLRQQGMPPVAPPPVVPTFGVQFAGRNPTTAAGFLPPRSVTPPPSPSRPMEFAPRPKIQRSPGAGRKEGGMGRAALSDDDRAQLVGGARGPAAFAQPPLPQQILHAHPTQPPRKLLTEINDPTAGGAGLLDMDSGNAAVQPKPLSLWERRHAAHASGSSAPGSSSDNSPNAGAGGSSSLSALAAPPAHPPTQRGRPTELEHTKPPLHPAAVRDKSAPPVMSPVRRTQPVRGNKHRDAAAAAESPGKEMAAEVSYHEVPSRSAVDDRLRLRNPHDFPADGDDEDDELFDAEVEEDAILEAHKRSNDGKLEAERFAEYDAMRSHIQTLISASPRARALLATRQPTDDVVMDDVADEYPPRVEEQWGEVDEEEFGDASPVYGDAQQLFVPEDRMFRLGHLCGDGFTGAAPVFLDGKLLMSSSGSAGSAMQAARNAPSQPGVNAEMLRSLLETAIGFDCLVAAYRHLSAVEEDGGEEGSRRSDAPSDHAKQEHVEVARDMIEQELRRRRGVEFGSDDDLGLLDDAQQYLAFLCQLVYFDEEVNRRQ